MTDPEYLEFRKSFYEFVVRDIEKAVLGNVEAGTIIMTVMAIECISGYYEGKNSNAETFGNFIQAFMPSYSAYAEDIYICIRNGLAHDYIIKENNGKSFYFTRNGGEKHLMPVDGKPGWIYINRFQFAVDFLNAQQNYFSQLTSNKDLYRKALKRLRKRSFLHVFPEATDTPTIYLDPSKEPPRMPTGIYQQNHPHFTNPIALPPQIDPIDIGPDESKTSNSQ